MDGFLEVGAVFISVKCVRCHMTEEMCTECWGHGYTTGIGNRRIECKNGRHHIYHIENSKMSPRGTLKWAEVDGIKRKVIWEAGEFKLIK